MNCWANPAKVKINDRKINDRNRNESINSGCPALVGGIYTLLSLNQPVPTSWGLDPILVVCLCIGTKVNVLITQLCYL